MIQEVYVNFCCAGIVEKFDVRRGCKISTYLFPIILNLVRSRKSVAETNRRQVKFDFDADGDAGEPSFGMDGVLQHGIDRTFSQSNIKDVLDGHDLSSDLDDFHDRFMTSRDKKYTLNRRRNKAVKTEGCSLRMVFRLLRDGFTQREIARMHGMSDAFVMRMKRELASALRAYGFSRG